MKSAIFQQPVFSFAVVRHTRPSKQRRGGPIPHGSRPELKKGNVAHVTIKLRKGLPSLREGEAFQVVIAAIARVNGGELVRIVEFWSCRTTCTC